KGYFEKAYPDYKNMYNTRANVFKTAEIVTGDGYGSVNFPDDSNVEIVPGPQRASTITLQFDEKETSLNFKATFSNKESIANECNPERDGEINLTVLEDGKEIKKLYITHKQDVPITLDISGRKKITLIVDKGKNEDYCDWFKLTDFTVK
ncbi:MAG: NPCBM/NEW2 domain-containing protein, partial [Bacteroidota bacterium]